MHRNNLWIILAFAECIFFLATSHVVHETRKLACVRCVLLRQRIIERDCPSPTPCPPKIRGIFDSWSFAHAFVRIFPFITHYSTQTSDRLRAKRILADHVTAGRCVACGYATLQQCIRGKKNFAALSRSLHASSANVNDTNRFTAPKI